MNLAWDTMPDWTDRAARRMYEGAGLGSKDVDIFNPYSRDHSKFDINAIIDYNNDMQTEAPT